MKRLFWILRATLWYKALVSPIKFSLAWGMAESLWHTYEAFDGETSPEGAVREDLTYWD